MIECQTCGWVGTEDQLEEPYGLSGIEPGCPACGNNDFLDVEEKEDGD